VGGSLVLLFALHRRGYIGGLSEPEGKDCAYCCGGCCVARLFVIAGGVVAAVLGTVWFAERWKDSASCDSTSAEFGRNFVIAGWAVQLIFCWLYCCVPALRDGWELDRNERLSVDIAPPGAPDVEEAGSQPNPLAADNGDESLSLVGAESPAGQGQASNRE